MAQRSVREIMEEGQRLTLEHAELLRKSIVGTLTTEESARKGVLEGYLLGLMGEAQAQGVGTAVGTGFGQVQPVEDEDEDVLGLDEPDAGDRYGTGGYGFGY